MIVDAAEKTPLPILPEVPDLVWGSVSFVIVALVIFKLAWPTFTRTLDERTRKIDEGLNAAARARDEVAQERAALSAEIDQAHREAAQIREKAQANAVAIVDEAKKAAGVEASRVTEAAQRQIAADTQIAKAQLRRDVGSLATELAGRIVGRQVLDPKVSQTVVDGFLDELEAGVAAPAGAASQGGAANGAGSRDAGRTKGDGRN